MGGWGLGATLHSTQGIPIGGWYGKKKSVVGVGGWTLVPVKERGGINEAIKAPGSLRGIVGGRAAG